MMPEVIGFIDSLCVHPEVVSEYEFEAIPDKSFWSVCNGVAMTYEELTRHVVNGELVNFNDIVSIEEVIRLAAKSEVSLEGKWVGLRVRFDESSRFGVMPGDVRKAVDLIEKNGMHLACLHCHVTGTRELTKYRKKVQDLVDVIVDNDLHPEYIDFGGSMYGEMNWRLKAQFDQVGDFGDYAAIINEGVKEIVKENGYKPKVILELGTALIANAVSVVGNVIRVDEYGRAVLDIDKYTIGQMIYKDVPYNILPSRSILRAPRPAYKVFGCSCIEDDVLIKNFEGELAVGDKIEFANCGAYSYCFEPDFIIPRQEIQVL